MEKLNNPGVITPGTVLARQLVHEREISRGNPEISVLDHQQDAMAAMRKYIGQGGTAGNVEMATSTGKSFLIAQTAQAAADLGMRVLVLAPTVNIARQLHGEDGTRGLGKFTRLHEEGKVAKSFGGTSTEGYHDSPVLVTTYQGLIAMTKKDAIAPVDLILADEAHRSLGDVTSETVTSFSPNAIKIGFTATPEFTSERSVRRIFHDNIYSLDIKQAVENGLTPPIRSLIFETDAEIPVLDPNYPDFTERELSRLMTLRQRNEMVLDTATELVASGRQGIIKCIPGDDLKHARLISEELAKRSIPTQDTRNRRIRTAAVGSHLKPHENQVLLAEFDKGNIDVLTFVQSLNEGWDSVKPRFAINASPTTSMVNEGQFLGRLLRGEDDVIFIDFMDRSNKQQVTSLHILGEERINVEHAIGGIRSKSERKATSLENIFSSRLYRRFKATDGKLVSELHSQYTESEVEYLTRKWENILEKEGLGADLPNFFRVDPIIVDALAHVRRNRGKWPFLSEATTYIRDNGIMKGQYSPVYDTVRATNVESQPKQTITEIVTGDVPAFIAEKHLTADALHAFAARHLSERGKEMLDSYFAAAAATDSMGKPNIEYMTAHGVENADKVAKLATKAVSILRHAPDLDEIRRHIGEIEGWQDWYLNEYVMKWIPPRVYQDKFVTARLYVDGHNNKKLHFPLEAYEKTKPVEMTIPMGEYLTLRYGEGKDHADNLMRSGDLSSYSLKEKVLVNLIHHVKPYNNRIEEIGKLLKGVNVDVEKLVSEKQYLRGYTEQFNRRIGFLKNKQAVEAEEQRRRYASGIFMSDNNGASWY